MLFNSYSFIFFFLPITAIVFFGVAKTRQWRLARLWLLGASLFFYAWWNLAYLTLILGSIAFNYWLGGRLRVSHKNGDQQSGRGFLIIGVITNLLILGYYKYANFFIDNVNTIFRTEIAFEPLILPIAISFFTFQQIAYLVDAYRAETEAHSFLDYGLFITFFPQLIAGPIVHHKEMLPQFKQPSIYGANSHSIAVGLTIFFIGLFKKVMLADQLAVYAKPVFDAALDGTAPSFAAGWVATLSYTFQIYFDFSGYSDMAIGLALLFGIKLPLNFDSPYQAVNMIDFWRRWHMTLSRFLRDYLYIPFGGNRKGLARRYFNLMITMVIGGLWHGASWTFVAWGALHGCYLVVNHAWRAIIRHHCAFAVVPTPIARVAARLLTFVAVVIGWVFFRAENFGAALTILEAMCGLHGMAVDLPRGAATYLLVSFIITWSMPNTQQIVTTSPPVFNTYRFDMRLAGKHWWQWRPSLLWLLVTCLIASLTIGNLVRVSEFLYFQF